MSTYEPVVETGLNDFNGKIAEIRLYQKALTQSEILTIEAAGPP